MVSRCNAEAYPDPTPFEALSAIEAERAGTKAYKPIVYIFSPFAGDVRQNIQKARRYCRFSAGKGYLPLAPHLIFPQFLNDKDPAERELGMHFGGILLRFCRELWVFGDTISQGMDTEIRRARWKGLKIRHFREDLKEVEP